LVGTAPCRLRTDDHSNRWARLRHDRRLNRTVTDLTGWPGSVGNRLWW
jgi:hypothetical protein